MPSTSPIVNNPAPRIQSSGQPVSLSSIFQVVTCCCVFFAVLRLSPLAALVLTIVVAPALIRTAYLAEINRRQDRVFSLKQRLVSFAKSISVVLLTFSSGALAFLIVSMLFGALGVLFGFAVSSSDYLFEAGIIGTIGGMVWGIAAGFLAMVFILFRFWGSPIK